MPRVRCVAEAVLEQRPGAPGDESAAGLLDRDGHEVGRAAVEDLVGADRPARLLAAVERDLARLTRSREGRQPEVGGAVGVDPGVDDPVAVGVEGGRVDGAVLDHGAHLAGPAIEDEEAGGVEGPQDHPSAIGRDVEIRVGPLRRPQRLRPERCDRPVGRTPGRGPRPGPSRRGSLDRREGARACRRSSRSAPAGSRSRSRGRGPTARELCAPPAGRNRNLPAVERGDGDLEGLDLRRDRLDRPVARHPHQAGQIGSRGGT